MDKACNNNANITGEIISGFTYRYKAFGQRIYQMLVRIKRRGHQEDTIPVLVPEYGTVLDVNKDYIGCNVLIAGRFQSFNRKDDIGNHLDLSIHVRTIRTCEELACENTNQIYLTGFICKKPILRMTPKGKVITDLLLAVNRSSGTADYIPCIVWNRNANRVSNLEIGEKVEIEGRMQSREYIKKLNDDTYETRVAYEVSVNKIGKIAAI